MATNDLGQPIGEALPEWRRATSPPRTTMSGRFGRIEPVDPDRHGPALFGAFSADRENRIWTYLPYGPFPDERALLNWMRTSCLAADPLFHAIVDARTGLAAGLASYLRIEPAIGVIEVGHINLAPSLQRTPAATEAMYLMMRRVFDELGYRRYEWKCDSLNAPSRRAALRLGFVFEGVFRQATIYKGRNRDTAWFSILDHEWPALRSAYEAWLDPANQEADGQRFRLAELIAERRRERDG